MQKYMRWSGLLVVLMLVLAACSADSGGSSEPSAEGEHARQQRRRRYAADCDADEFGCVEIAEGDPMIIGTELVITGANESLGLDSQYGAEVARTMRARDCRPRGRIQPPG